MLALAYFVRCPPLYGLPMLLAIIKARIINEQTGKAWGFGQLTVPKAAFASDKRSKLGTWINDNTFFEQGWYVDNKLAFSCPSEQACRAQAATDPVKKAAITQTENHLAD